MYINNNRIEYVKPILYSASNGYIYHHNIQKNEPEFGDLLVRVGGPAYSVGLGGGSASSKSHNDTSINNDLKAVQRGDPEMENKMYKFVKRCFEMLNENPILSIHGEGKIVKDENIDCINNCEVAFSYLDYNNTVTEEYPFNPNGSEQGIAGLSSNNGRCLGIMPHPERSIKS